MIRNNWKFKLLALMVSLILWFHVNSERNPRSTRTFDVSLRSVGIARSHIAELDTPKVTVTVAGLKTAVDALAKDDVEAWVDLGRLRLGQDVTKASLAVEKRLPRAIQNELDVTVSPAKVGVRVEAIREKRLPVEVVFTSDPPPGFSYGTPTLTPGSVVIHGAAGALSKVKQVLLTLDGDAAGSATEYYEIFAVGSSGSAVPGVTVKPNKVKAKLDMVEVPATKTVLVSPVLSGMPKFPLRVARYAVTPSFVTLRGKPSRLATISVISTDKIDIEGAEGTVSHDADLRVPSGVRVAGSSSVKVTVYVASE